jgi:hypothetical protein
LGGVQGRRTRPKRGQASCRCKPKLGSSSGIPPTITVEYLSTSQGS